MFFCNFLALSWERLPLPSSVDPGLGGFTSEPLILVSEDTSKVGLLEVFPDLVLETGGGGGGAGFGFANFPFSLSLCPGISEVCLSLRGLISSRVGNTLGLKSSACKALVLEVSVCGRLPSFGVRVKGLDPGLDSESLKTSSDASSVFLGRRGGGVRVPPLGMQSAFLRGKAGLPPMVPDSK